MEQRFLYAVLMFALLCHSLREASAEDQTSTGENTLFEVIETAISSNAYSTFKSAIDKDQVLLFAPDNESLGELSINVELLFDTQNGQTIDRLVGCQSAYDQYVKFTGLDSFAAFMGGILLKKNPLTSTH